MSWDWCWWLNWLINYIINGLTNISGTHTLFPLTNHNIQKVNKCFSVIILIYCIFLQMWQLQHRLGINGTNTRAPWTLIRHTFSVSKFPVHCSGLVVRQKKKDCFRFTLKYVSHVRIVLFYYYFPMHFCIMQIVS
jgi:hypothetical protein